VTHVITDGYNLLLRIPALSAMIGGRGLEAARDELLRRLAGYHHLTGNRVTVVFDGQGKGGETRLERRSGIAVHYSAQGQTADVVVIKLAASTPDATVVSSDREVREAALLAGAAVIDSDGFWRIASDLARRRPAEDADGEARDMPRKGTARRRSKAERRRVVAARSVERRLRGE
jgi:predicted RNA-binding protein with PIN domain